MTEAPPTGDRPGHLDDDVLRTYAAEPLPAATAALVDLHLDRCARCRERLSELEPGQTTVGLWQQVDRRLDEPTRSLLERCALRLGVPEYATRLCAAVPSLRWSWWGGAAFLLILAAVVGRWAEATSAPLLFLAVAPALSAVSVAVVTGQRFDPAYAWLVVAPLNGFTVVLVRAAAVQAMAVVLTGACAVALPLAVPYLLGWLVPSLMLTAVCLALSSRTDAARAVLLTLAAWAVGLAVTYRPQELAGTLLLLPEAQLVMAGVTALAAGTLVLLRDGFDRHVPPPLPIDAPGAGSRRLV